MERKQFAGYLLPCCWIQILQAARNARAQGRKVYSWRCVDGCGVGVGQAHSLLKLVEEVLLYVHRNRRFITSILGTGAQDVHLDSHTAPEL